MKRIMVGLFLAVGLFVVAPANAAPVTHAAVKTAKFTWTGIKKTIGTVAFAFENGVDVVHGATSVVDKALLAVNGVKILIPVEKVVHVVDVDVVGKLDLGTELVIQWGWGVAQ